MESFGKPRPTQRRHHSGRTVVVAAFLTAATLLSSCGSGGDDATSKKAAGDELLKANPDNCPVGALDDAADKVDITVWHAYNALTQEAIEKAATTYNASQDKVTVHVEAQGTYEELLKKYSDRLDQPESLPDVIFSEDTTMRFMIDSGSVIAAADCVAADSASDSFYSDLLPVIKNTYTVKGILWPAAFGMSMPIMYLNTDHFKAAGLDPTKPPATLDEVREAAEKIKAANLPGMEAPVVMQLFGWYPENWLTGSGQSIVDNDNGHSGLATKSTIDNDKTREIFEWLQGMEKDGLLKAYPHSGGIDQFLAIGNRSSSILIDGSRAITSVHAIVANSYEGNKIEGTEGIDAGDLEDLDVTVAPIPGLDKAGQGGAAGSAAYVVAGPTPAKIAASWDFLKYFNTEAIQAQWTIQGSYLPVTNALQESPEIVKYFTDDPAGRWLNVVNTQLKNATPDFASPVIGPYDQFRSGIHSAMDRIVFNGADVDSTLKSFDADFQKALDDYANEVGG